MTVTTRLNTRHQKERAKQLIDRAPEGWVCVLREETRNDAQNRALHGYITQLRRALPDTVGRFSMEQVKLQFMDALGAEMVFLPKLEGPGQFPVGQKTSALSVGQFSALLELIAAYAARHGVELKES